MNLDTIYYINEEWVLSKKATIPFNDSGFLYGDGIFETLRFDNRKIFSFNKHFHRLMKGLRIIDLSIPNKFDELKNILELLIKKNYLDSGIIRLMVTRGTIKTLLSKSKPNLYISIKPFYELPKEPVKVLAYDRVNDLAILESKISPEDFFIIA